MVFATKEESTEVKYYTKLSCGTFSTARLAYPKVPEPPFFILDAKITFEIVNVSKELGGHHHLVIETSNEADAEEIAETVLTIYELLNQDNCDTGHFSLLLNSSNPYSGLGFAGIHDNSVYSAAYLATKIFDNNDSRLATLHLKGSFREATCQHDFFHPYAEFPIHTKQNIVNFASAIQKAYAAVEQLGLELRASAQNPSRNSDGTINKIVYDELATRLKSIGIDPYFKLLWYQRGTARGWDFVAEGERIVENKYHGYEDADHRDVSVVLTYCIFQASYLRSRLASHALSDRSEQLNVYDAINVQSLATVLLVLKHSALDVVFCNK